MSVTLIEFEPVGAEVAGFDPERGLSRLHAIEHLPLAAFDLNHALRGVLKIAGSFGVNRGEHDKGFGDIQSVESEHADRIAALRDHVAMIIVDLARGGFDLSRAGRDQIERTILMIIFTHPDANILGAQSRLVIVGLGQMDGADRTAIISRGRFALHAHFRVLFEKGNKLNNGAADPGLLRF